ncbi:MAG: hypothetical protein AAGE93_11535 [Bacteroidota bacterium]
MSKDISQAIRILELLRHFSDDHPNGSIKEFAQWIIGSSHTENSEQFPNVNETPPDNNYAAYLVGRLSRYTSLWGKKMFKNALLRSIDEYGVLKLVQLHPGSRKSDIVYKAMLEPTTSFEIVKRLHKMGYLYDKPDQKDLRTKQVFITEEGQKAIAQIDDQLAKVSDLLLGDLDDNEVRRLTELLIKLDQFHQKIYFESRDETLDTIIRTYVG